MRNEDKPLTKVGRRAALKQGSKLAYVTPLVLGGISAAEEPKFSISRHGKGKKPGKLPDDPLPKPRPKK